VHGSLARPNGVSTQSIARRDPPAAPVLTSDADEPDRDALSVRQPSRDHVGRWRIYLELQEREFAVKQSGYSAERHRADSATRSRRCALPVGGGSASTLALRGPGHHQVEAQRAACSTADATNCDATVVLG
jgi:hypothetical protein